MKDNNFNFNPVFLNTLDSGASEQLLSFLHLNNISANISEKSLSILLAKASFALLLISMLSYWFQMSFKSQNINCKVMISSRNINYASPYVQSKDRACAAEGKRKAITCNKTDRKNFLEKVPLISMWSANITLALLLSIRWIESGHFPLSNLYESLIFLSWSLTVIHLFLENLFYKREQISSSLSPSGYASAPTLTLGAITSPVALFTNAFATFSLPQEMQKVTVLVPALKSNWLIMHVSVMIISYAALLSGSLLAMAFLVIKFIDDNKVPSIIFTFINYVSSLTQLINRELVDKKQLSSSASYSSTPMGSGNKSISSASCTKQTVGLAQLEALQDTGVKAQYLPGSWQSKEELPVVGQQGSAAQLPKPLGKELFSYTNDYQDCLAQESEGALLAQHRNLTKENKVLPQILDNLSYRSIGLGFALLTIGILSGAVWANEAWGSYWSWDPKETWALITWLVFALYLHTRLSKGWVGKESAFVASFGFIVIWFCYLGVNLFGKGLHSYGWFQQ